jgi:hypothetical protein
LREQLDVDDDWHQEVDDENNHSRDPALSAEILVHGISVVNVFARGVQTHPAGVRGRSPLKQSDY